MSRIRSKNTKPELVVRSLLHNMGYRFRLHRSDLPGRPDIVLPRLEVVINVHGCFWHQHFNCVDCSKPKSNRQFWKKKLDRNVARDRLNSKALKDFGWNEFIVWECEARDTVRLKRRLVRFLAIAEDNADGE